MPEIKKYNLVKELHRADEIYAHSAAVYGMSSMTHSPYNNSTRTQMFTAHLNQVINMVNPEFPLVMTGAENTVGKHSSGYRKMKHDSIIFRKVAKFKDLLEHPYIVQVFYYDKKKKKYDVFCRKECVNLGQSYGYKANNKVIDSLKDGDEVKEGTVLWRSHSYDKDMNYRFGANLPTIYSYDPWTSEDAAIISETASKIMATTHSDTFEWGWNQNDIPMNVHGDKNHYLPLAKIGDMVSGIVANSRAQINDQLGYDFKEANLTMNRDGDREITFFGSGKVLDYDIYCNNFELEDKTYNHQILVLLEHQRRYWQEIQDVCLEIMDSGEDYTRRVDNLYDRSIKFLNQKPNERWYDGNSTYGNLKIRMHVMSISPLAEGGKFTARYGNKSVVSRVLPDHLMPFDAEGNHVHVILNQPAIINRTTGFVPHEMHINWCTELIRREMEKQKTRVQKEKLLWKTVDILNHKQCEKMQARYLKLTAKEKDAYIASVIKNGIIIHQDSIDEDRSIFFKLLDLEEEFSFLKPQTLYQYKWGRIYRINARYCPGKMYFMPLKQTDQRGFSARNTGAVNMKGLPERSYKNKRNEAPFSDTAIRFGEYETLNFLIGTEPGDFCMTHAFYRSSPDASSDLTKAQFVEQRMGVFKKFYKNRAAEIFNVIYKHLGLELQFRNKNMIIQGMDKSRMREFTYKGKTYFMTELDFHTFRLRERIKEKLLNEHIVLDHATLEQKIEEELAKMPSVNGTFLRDVNIFGTKEELTDEEVMKAS